MQADNGSPLEGACPLDDPFDLLFVDTEPPGSTTHFQARSRSFKCRVDSECHAHGDLLITRYRLRKPQFPFGFDYQAPDTAPDRFGHLLARLGGANKVH